MRFSFGYSSKVYVFNISLLLATGLTIVIHHFEMCVIFWWEMLTGEDHLDSVIGSKILKKWSLNSAGLGFGESL